MCVGDMLEDLRQNLADAFISGTRKLSLMYSYVAVGSVQYVASLLFAYLCYFLIIRFIFRNVPFILVCMCFLSCEFGVFAFFVYCFSFSPVSLLFSYKSTDLCQRVETQLQYIYIYIYIYIYRLSQEECASLQEGVPYVKVHQYNPKHLCPKLNGYGDNGQRSLKPLQLLHTY